MKHVLFALCYLLGITRLARWMNRRRVAILCFHGVTERATRRPDDPCGLHIRRQRFLAQVRYLQRRYRVISLRDYLEARREGRRLPDSTAILTFDDGFRNFLTVAAPCLAASTLPTTLFLITDRVGGQDGGQPATRAWDPQDDETYLSWAEIETLTRDWGIELGSHTCTHARLTSLPEAEVERELRESGAVIAARLGQNHGLPFAYPFGAYSASVARRARSLGYRCALTTDEGVNGPDADLFFLKRLLIGDDDAIPAFAARVSGLTSAVRRLLAARAK